MDMPRELRLIADRTDDEQDASIIARAAAMIEGQLALIDSLQSDTGHAVTASLAGIRDHSDTMDGGEDE